MALAICFFFYRNLSSKYRKKGDVIYMANSLKIKRIYEEPAPDDGTRILVDRLWPRGVKKERAALDGWWKVVAPSPELRKWFAHDPEKFEEFRVLYTAELDENPEAAKYREKINSMLKGGNVTLLYGAKDPEHNHAIVLAEWLMH